MGQYAALLVLLILAVSAADSIMGLAYRNSLLLQNETYMSASPRVLPGSSTPSRSHYTGIYALDEWLVGLVIVFWETVCGSVPKLSLFAVYMAGQCLATHTIVTLEGLRVGNKGRAISFSGVWGLVYQSIPWGIIKPIYWSVWFLTSPLARMRSQDASKKTAALISADTTQLRILPAALTLGFVVPTILTALPAPSMWSIDQKQVVLVIWQGFPLWVSAAQFGLGLLVPHQDRPSPASTMRSLRNVYKYTLGLTAATHISVLVLAAFPHLLSATGILYIGKTGDVSLASVFRPQSPLSKVTSLSFAEKTHTLLLYDMYYACAATLFWAVSVRNSVKKETFVKNITEILMYTVLCGPGGAALLTMWTRDEDVFERLEVIEKGKKL